jgi:hypothetical protein
MYVNMNMCTVHVLRLIDESTAQIINFAVHVLFTRSVADLLYYIDAEHNMAHSYKCADTLYSSMHTLFTCYYVCK